MHTLSAPDKEFEKIAIDLKLQALEEKTRPCIASAFEISHIPSVGHLLILDPPPPPPHTHLKEILDNKSIMTKHGLVLKGLTYHYVYLLSSELAILKGDIS